MAENYREKYKTYYGIEFDKNFDIHHIDFNHDNDDIENLILLPHPLHMEYHRALNEIIGINDISRLKRIDIHNGCTLEIDALKSFCEVMQKIQHWKLYKTTLDIQRSLSNGGC